MKPRLPRRAAASDASRVVQQDLDADRDRAARRARARARSPPSPRSSRGAASTRCGRSCSFSTSTPAQAARLEGLEVGERVLDQRRHPRRAGVAGKRGKVDDADQRRWTCRTRARCEMPSSARSSQVDHARIRRARARESHPAPSCRHAPLGRARRLDREVREGLVEPARDRPGALAEHREQRRHHRHAHDQRVGQDRDAEQEAELLRDAIVADREGEEHRAHDQRGGDDHAADAGDAVGERAAHRLAPHVLLAHPAHQEDLVVHREAEQDGERDRRHERLDRPGPVEPEDAHAVPELDDADEHAEPDERREQRGERRLDGDHERAERHREQQHGHADDEEQEPRQPVQDLVADVGERRVLTGHVGGDAGRRARPCFAAARRGRRSSSPAARTSSSVDDADVAGLVGERRRDEHEVALRAGDALQRVVDLVRVGLAALDDDGDRRREARAEAVLLVREDVVGLARRLRLRRGAGVGRAEPHLQRGRGHQQRDDQRDDEDGRACAVTNRPQRATGVFCCPSNDSSACGSRMPPRSILWPSIASTAGSSVFARITEVSTPSAPPMPMTVMNRIPIVKRPRIEIATVMPAKITARPAVAAAPAAASRGEQPVVQQLSEPRHDEQRVVDADAESDHRRDDRRDRVDVDHGRGEVQQHERRGHGDDREDQRDDRGHEARGTGTAARSALRSGRRSRSSPMRGCPVRPHR